MSALARLSRRVSLARLRLVTKSTTLTASSVSPALTAAATGVRGVGHKIVRNPVRGGVPTSFDPDRSAKEQDKLLYTPGPLTTSYSVKKAMVRDLGSRDGAFIQVIKEVCAGLLNVAKVSPDEFVTIPMQGSGTFGVEAVLSSVVNKKTGGLLIISNGAYGVRMRDIAKAHSIPFEFLETPEDTQPDLKAIEAALKSGKTITHVAVIHSETTSGILNDVEKIGALVKKHNKSYIVDAMSSFGAVPVDFDKGSIDYLVSSSNKCIEGVPGFSFVIARNSALEASRGNADTVSLDIHKQNDGFKKNAQFRFTPPTHAILAFGQALAELEMEGGVSGRMRRYQQNQEVLQKGMEELGFATYLKADVRGWIITSYRYPKDKNWNFEKFYSLLNERGFVIYPGKVSNADCFRIGHIGRVFPQDSTALLKAIDQVCREMRTCKYLPKYKKPTPGTPEYAAKAAATAAAAAKQAAAAAAPATGAAAEAPKSKL